MNTADEVLAGLARWAMVHASNLDLMSTLPDNCVDSIVTDPPAGISFMGSNRWDDFGDEDLPPREGFMDFIQKVFTEALRVVKPGGYALVWALPRTAHWTTMAIEYAGWEIRDSIDHVFGQGMAKGLNISKAMDKYHGAAREVVGENPNHRSVSGVNYDGVYGGGNTGAKYITAPASDDAKKWDGYGTMLKPAHENWILCRKPVDQPTIVENLLKWGTGAINVDAGRISTDDKLTRKLGKTTTSSSGWASVKRSDVAGKDGGRWPPNFIISHSEACADVCADDCIVPELGDRAKFFPNFRYVSKAPRSEKDAGCEDLYWAKDRDRASGYRQIDKATWEATPQNQRADGNIHNTVKGIELMSWLCKIVTPEDGVCLDLFAGSGTTGLACLESGLRFIGADLEEDYVAIATARLSNHQQNRPALD